MPPRVSPKYIYLAQAGLRGLSDHVNVLDTSSAPNHLHDVGQLRKEEDKTPMSQRDLQLDVHS
jgi:hypothetical protein